MPLNDEHFVIDEDSHHDFDPSGFAKADVGATKGSNLKWVKIGGLILIVAIGYWFTSRSLTGAAFTVEGLTLSVPSQGWQTTLPAGWKAERGTVKTEIVAYPSSLSDIRAATREGKVVRLTTGDKGSAQTAFKDAYTKTQGRNATFTDLSTPGGKAVRGDEPAGGKVSVFVDGDPTLLITAPLIIEEIDTIVASLKRTPKQ